MSAESELSTRAEPSSSSRLDAWLTPLRERSLLTLILAAALTVRIALDLQMRASPYFDDPQLDQGFFAAWGRRVAAGEWIPVGPFERPPLYAWFLGAMLKLGDGSLLAPRIAQALIGTFSVFCVWKLARELVSRPAALSAALIAALAWPLVYYDGELVREPLAIASNLLALWLTLRWTRERTLASGLGAGLAFGLSALVRPQVLVALVALAMWALATKRARPLGALVLVASALIPIAPITLHNLRANGDLVLVSPESGQALWIGNNPEADGVTAVAPGTRRGFEEQQEDAHAIAERETGRMLRPSEVSSFWSHRALTWITSHPVMALEITAHKLAILVSGFEFGGNPEEPRFFAERFAPIVGFLPFGFAFVFTLAAVGVWSRRKRYGESAMLLVFLAAYGATVLLVLVSARHRLPLVPILCVFAGAGLTEFVSSALERRPRALVTSAAVAILAFSATTVQTVPLAASNANGLFWLASAAARAGDPAKAVELLDQAIAQRSDFAYLHTARGAALSKLGRTEDARRAFTEAVRLAPEDVVALDALAEIELSAGRLDAARALAERSIQAAPHLARALYVRGRAHLYAHELQAAADDFTAALERAPDYFNAAFALGAVLEESKRPADAYAAYRRAAEHMKNAPLEFQQANLDALIRLAAVLGDVAASRDWERQRAHLGNSIAPPTGPIRR